MLVFDLEAGVGEREVVGLNLLHRGDVRRGEGRQPELRAMKSTRLGFSSRAFMCASPVAASQFSQAWGMSAGY